MDIIFATDGRHVRDGAYHLHFEFNNMTTDIQANCSVIDALIACQRTDDHLHPNVETAFHIRNTSAGFHIDVIFYGPYNNTIGRINDMIRIPIDQFRAHYATHLPQNYAGYTQYHDGYCTGSRHLLQ